MTKVKDNHITKFKIFDQTIMNKLHNKLIKCNYRYFQWTSKPYMNTCSKKLKT